MDRNKFKLRKKMIFLESFEAYSNKFSSNFEHLTRYFFLDLQELSKEKIIFFVYVIESENLTPKRRPHENHQVLSEQSETCVVKINDNK